MIKWAFTMYQFFWKRKRDLISRNYLRNGLTLRKIMGKETRGLREELKD